MHDELDLDYYKKRLEERLAAIKAGKKGEGRVELDQICAGRLSRMDAMQQQAMAQAADRLTDFERQCIGAAFKRIDSGDYGCCVVCGEEIAEGHPRFDPSVLMCISCAEKAEAKYQMNVAAYRVQDFFDHPSPVNYLELEKATEKIDCWPAVRAAGLFFLECGQRPDMTDGGSAGQPWPLPCSEVTRPDKRFRRDSPDLDTFIEIAILEKRFDDVVQLYHAHQKTLRWGIGKGIEVAEAVAGTHPDISLVIWKKLAEGQINLAKPKAYEEAAVYLRKMHKIYQETKRLEQWRNLIQTLRSEHKPKRRLLEVLDSLENKRIID